MPTFLRDLRNVLQFQCMLSGSFLPMGAEPEAADAVSTPAPAERLDRAPVNRAPVAEGAGVETGPVEAKPEDPARPPLLEPDALIPSMDLFGNQTPPSQDESKSPYVRIASLIPEGSPLRSMTSLEEIATYLKNTVLVPIDKDRINPVLGTGDPNAGLMIIGEAPGAEEDKTGEPFTGRAGMLLNKILEAINFEREEVYITNILKSRPPNNRDPEKEEVEAHIPILYKQISLIKPRILLCVGKTAGNSMLDRRSSLASLRGKFHDFYGLPLMVTYHPAALLRNPQWKRPTWEDVKLLRTRYDQLTGD